MKHFAFIITTLFLISCQPNEKINPSTHKIVFLTPYYEAFVKGHKTYNKKSGKVYREKLYELMIKRYFSDCEYIDALSRQQIDTTERFNADHLGKTLELINLKYKFIREKIDIALLKCNYYLPYDSVTVFIAPNLIDREELARKVKGVGGLTVGSKHIILNLDPSINEWEDMLEIAVAHEFNHAYWIKHNLKTCKETLLDYLVVEGKAETFSHLLYPDVKNPWDSTLSEKQKTELWNKIKTKLNNKDYSLQKKIMFGDSIYPFDGGYILGRDIVTAAIKKEPGVEPKYWTNFSAEYLLKRSGYK
jgi:uncharacterized protein YjaZ